MTILSIDDRLVTQAVLNYLRGFDDDGNVVTPAADLSTDESGNVGVILVGDHAAPTPDDDDDTLTEIHIVAGTMKPYLVLYQVPMGAAIDRANRSGYAGGTPSTDVIRWQITGVALEIGVAQRLAIYAAARLCDPPYPLTSTTDHEMARWERVLHGTPDREGQLWQWTEFVEADVSRAL